MTTRFGFIEINAPGFDGCIATNKIIVEGYPVRFMYRETPVLGIDGGWRFMSGFEDEAYMENPANLDVCDVNAVAHLDPGITPFLKAAEGSAFARTPGATTFALVVGWEDAGALPRRVNRTSE